MRPFPQTTKMNARNSCARCHLMSMLFLITPKVAVAVCHSKCKNRLCTRESGCGQPGVPAQYRSCCALRHMGESQHLLRLLCCRSKPVLVTVREKPNPGDLTWYLSKWL